MVNAWRLIENFPSGEIMGLRLSSRLFQRSDSVSFFISSVLSSELVVLPLPEEVLVEPPSFHVTLLIAVFFKR